MTYLTLCLCRNKHGTGAFLSENCAPDSFSTFVHSPSPPQSQEHNIPPLSSLPPHILDLPNVPMPEPILSAVQSSPTPTCSAPFHSIPEDHSMSTWSAQNPGKAAQDQQVWPSCSQTAARKRISVEKALT